MKDLSKKLNLPKMKIKRESLVVAGLLIIALAIPLTVVLLGVRQELRKRAAPTTGSILINDGAATTASRDVTLTLTAPTSQASLIRPNFKIPQAHAANCIEFRDDPSGSAVFSWKLPSYDNPYYLTTYVCNKTDGPTQISAWVYSTSDPNVSSGSGGLGVQTLAAGACKSVTFTFNMVGGWTTKQGTVATAKVIATSRDVGNWGCYQDLTQTVTFGTADAPTPTPTTPPGVTPTPTPTTPPGVTPTPTPTTPPDVTPTPTPTTVPYSSQWTKCENGSVSCDALCQSQGKVCTNQCSNKNGTANNVGMYHVEVGQARQDGTCAQTTSPLDPAHTVSHYCKWVWNLYCCCFDSTVPTPTDTPPTVVGMMISNDSNFSGASEEPFATTKSWTLTEGNGTKTVHTKFKWSDGTWTDPIYDTITLDTSGPTPTPTPTTPPGVTPTPTPTTPPGVTPTPTPTTPPDQGYGTPSCDRIEVCHGTYCGAQDSSKCGGPDVRVYGHDSEGADVAFEIRLRSESGAILGSSAWTAISPYNLWGGLMSQRCDGNLTGSSKDPGPPYNACDFWIYTYGSGGYCFSQFVNYHTYSGPCDLHVSEEAVTYTVEAVASSVEQRRDPVTGQFLGRSVVGNWNEGGKCSTELTVYWDQEKKKFRCYEGSGGDLPTYEKPVISGTQHYVSNDTGQEGYANVRVTFNTDIEAEARVYYNVSTMGLDACDPFGGWKSSTSTGTSHSINLNPNTLWYSSEALKTYCYKVAAWAPGNEFATGARAYDPPRPDPNYSGDSYSFTLPSGGLGASDADLNGSGNVDIGDWGVLADSYGKEGAGLPGDFNNNNQIDILDVSVFFDAYLKYGGL